MAKPRYRHAHQQERKRWQSVVDRGEAYCVEPLCLMRDRWIPPGSDWDVCHDETGTITTGPGHVRCNRSEGARRGNRLRSSEVSTANRWAL